MALWPQFCGGAYTSRSPTLDAEATVNRYPVTIDSATNPKSKSLFPTPGLRRLLSVSTTSCRGLFSEDGRTWAVVGNTLSELDLSANTATTLGTIVDDGHPVSFASNGRGGEQLAVCGGGALYIFELDTNTFVGPVSLPLMYLPTTVAFLDGYFLLLEASTVRVWFSALEDGESWDGLDFFARSQTSDNLVGLAVKGDRIWCLGTHTTDVWYDAGDADTPFLPYPGALIHEGLVGPWAWVIEGEALYWCAQNNQGRARIVRATDLQPQAISTDALDFALASYTSLEDTETLAYAQEGHGFVVFTFPSGGNCGVTWAWDTKESLWHQRASWDATLAIFYRWRVRGSCSTASGLIVGDYATGEIYELDLDTFTENGNLIRWLRRAPYLDTQNQWIFLEGFELGVQAGVGLSTGQGSDPTMLLRVSRDAGRTWGPSVSARLGKQGEYLTRAIWRRLGRARSDRLVVEVSGTDPVPMVIGPGAWLRVSEGSGAL